MASGEVRMAFDIYAGTFTRFYTREWENVVQRQARLDGTQYTMIYADGDEGPPSKEEVSSEVAAWRDEINEALAEHKLGPIEWAEDDSQPYFTDRPGWEGYSGLQLWAAYAERQGSKPPYALPRSWAEDAVWDAVMSNEAEIHFRTILQATVWLPGDFEFVFKFAGLTEDEVMIASTGRLAAQLRELGERQLNWQKPPLLEKFRTTKSIPLQEAAEWGRSSFLSVVDEAVKARVPFMLSF